MFSPISSTPPIGITRSVCLDEVNLLVMFAIGDGKIPAGALCACLTGLCDVVWLALVGAASLN
jgi:hypothetical protein